MALPRHNRLKRKRDFDAVFKTGRTVAGSFLFLKAAHGQGGRPRLGIVVSSRVAKTAVTRNRLRRVIAEAIQSRLLSAAGTYDMVMVVTRLAPDEATLRADVATVLQKARIL